MNTTHYDARCDKCIKHHGLDVEKTLNIDPLIKGYVTKVLGSYQ